ncbi:Tfp pilus assembly protein FimT/FimU [Marinibactrum halimedae]|uniref:Prepilin-type N-terminal cleavage/methylation domain-containing protein n=1 Tax=Marinibactrum halimedae TaxID=1444977 RepID=A0AA37WMV7_9GAMM|nr:prepilin-type N-terminal cleavage/methylation domain-containing protein [Marinibactrum halimedae]MCD9460818.1 prepilin-type N-terminal cleavage/methylation domain-containing protein [Marinibactrum halimedae]GLS26718.1 hypothetical protein GCM10007877_24350 [Marinibactrum halimedae]
MHRNGFTLIELITVLLIVAIISVYVGNRFSSIDSNLSSGRDDLIAALFFAQQIAMSRDSAANPITFVTSGAAIDVQASGASLSSAGVQYPVVLSNGVTVSPAVTLAYNKMGETTATVFTLSHDGASTQVTVEASGYVH